MVTNGNGYGNESHEDEVYFDAVRVIPPSEIVSVDVINGGGNEVFMRFCVGGQPVRRYTAIYCNQPDIVAAAQIYLNAKEAVREVDIIDSEGRTLVRKIGTKAVEEALRFLLDLLASMTFKMKVKKQKPDDVVTLMEPKVSKDQPDGILKVSTIVRPSQTVFTIPVGGLLRTPVFVTDGDAMLVVSFASEENPLLVGHVGKEDKFLGGVRIVSDVQKLSPGEANSLKEILAS